MGSAPRNSCVSVRPPQDHPHVFCDMDEDLEYVCPYCSTLYRHNPALAPNEARPAECELHHLGCGQQPRSVLLPFFDRAGQLLTTRLNVTHHQAPIFALTLCSFVVDSLADPFNRSFRASISGLR